MLPQPALPGRLGAHAEVFHRDERTGERVLVQTSIKENGVCAWCRRDLTGRVVLHRQLLVHADCARRAERRSRRG